MEILLEIPFVLECNKTQTQKLYGHNQCKTTYEKGVRPFVIHLCYGTRKPVIKNWPITFTSGYT